MNEDNLQVTFDDLTKGTKAPQLPPLQPRQDPTALLENATGTVKSAQDYITTLNTQEEAQRNDLLNRLLKPDGQSSQDVFNTTFDQQARETTGQSGQSLIQQLRDENTKLATLQGQFRTQAQKVSGREGQSQAFEAPQLNELERERVIQVGNQALLVQALQGNYNTARQIALDTANFATQDRKAELDTLITQYNAVQDIVSGQEAQVIAGKKAEAEAEKAELERTQKAVDGAIMSGVATPQEMQKLVSTQTDNATKQALAQQIMARGAGEDRSMAVEDRALDRTLTNAQIANTYSQMAQRDFENQLKIQELNNQLIGTGVAFTENGEEITPTKPPKAPTVSEQQSLIFFSRMKEAVDNLDAVETDIRGLGTLGQIRLNYAPAIAQSSEQQLYTQASRQFTEARLRKDSGAAIPPEEFANDRRMYFPQPGDDNETLEQKRKARETALAAIRQASGNAYWELYGESPTTVSRRVQSEQNEYQELLKNATPEELEALQNQ